MLKYVKFGDMQFFLSKAINFAVRALSIYPNTLSFT